MGWTALIAAVAASSFIATGALGAPARSRPASSSLDVATLTRQAAHEWKKGVIVDGEFYMQGSVWIRRSTDQLVPYGSLLQLDGVTLGRTSSQANWDCAYVLDVTASLVYRTDSSCTQSDDHYTFPYDPLSYTNPWGANSMIDFYDLTLDSGVVYGARAEGFYGQFPAALEAYSATDGSLIWTNSHFYGPVSESAGVVYVWDTGLSTLYALDSSDGQPLWHVAVDQTSSWPPVISDGFAYLGTGTYWPFGAGRYYAPGHVAAIDLSTHMIQWTAPRAGIVAAEGPDVILTTHDGLREVAGKTRRTVWSAPAPDLNQAALTGGVLWVTEQGIHKLFAFDPTTGQLLRTFSSNSDHAFPMVGDGRLYIIDHHRVRMFA